MYRISNDRRVQRSADAIVCGLVSALRTRDFEDLTVAEVQRKVHVGRATFYRLFDNLSDVLFYQCDQLGKELLATWHRGSSSKDATFLRFAIEFWIDRSSFLEALLKSRRSDILQLAIAAHILGPDGPAPFRDLDETQQTYAAAMISSMLSGALMAYISRGRKETPDELYANLLAGMGRIISYLAGK